MKNKERIQELEDNYSEDSLIYQEVRPQLERDLEKLSSKESKEVLDRIKDLEEKQ